MLNEVERTAHKRCCDCGRFVAKHRWTQLLADQRKDKNVCIQHPLCERCAEDYDPPEW